MTHDQRGTLDPIPQQLEDYLTVEQLAALQQAEQTGFKLRFVRRKGVSDGPVAFVANDSGQYMGILSRDGQLEIDLDPQLRSED